MDNHDTVIKPSCHWSFLKMCICSRIEAVYVKIICLIYTMTVDNRGYTRLILNFFSKQPFLF